METVAIVLTKEEIRLIYYQLVARKLDFEEEMKNAGSKGDTNRLLEIAEFIKSINIIMEKLLV